MARLVIMLPLLSTISPAVTGTSSLLKNVIFCGALSSTIWKAVSGRFGTASDFPSNTLTCSTTRSDSALKTGGSCGASCAERTAIVATNRNARATGTFISAPQHLWTIVRQNAPYPPSARTAAEDGHGRSWQLAAEEADSCRSRQRQQSEQTAERKRTGRRRKFRRGLTARPDRARFRLYRGDPAF